jgi:hypothetical protein
MYRGEGLQGNRAVRGQTQGPQEANMMQRHFRAWLLLLLCTAVYSFFWPTARAQVAVASINGAVTDPSGAVVPGAVIVLYNVSTNVEQSVSTNATGNYVFVDVIPGRYTLRVSKVLPPRRRTSSRFLSLGGGYAGSCHAGSHSSIFMQLQRRCVRHVWRP